MPTAHLSGLSPLGYLLALGPLLFISICDVWLQLFSHDQAYAINLAAVGTVALGCTGRNLGRGTGRAGGWGVVLPTTLHFQNHPDLPPCHGVSLGQWLSSLSF